METLKAKEMKILVCMCGEARINKWEYSKIFKDSFNGNKLRETSIIGTRLSCWLLEATAK